MKTLLLSLALVASTAAAHACGGYGDAPSHYFAHEWGTFTSIQGTDGVPIRWQSLVNNDLPDFVYNRMRAADAKELGATRLFFGKGEMTALQRMETPVIYFYSSKPVTVDVRVDFPQGTVTEWYPQISKFGPALGTNLTAYIDPQQRSKSYVEWSQVQIGTETHGPLPKEANRKSHYYAARETDAQMIKVNNVASSPGRAAQAQTEKFLFYRGLGNFASPLKAYASTDRSVVMENLVDAPLRHLFVIDRRADSYAYSYHAELPAKGTLTAGTSVVSCRTPVNDNRAGLIEAMKQSLVTSGLLEKEASAMVKTWEDSWFDEPGLRVLYILPDNWVNATLPLKLTPAPAKTARVFVGRAELLTPSIEQSLTKLVNEYGTATPAKAKAITEAVQKLQLGRFTQAAFDRVVRRQNDERFTSHAYALHATTLTLAPDSGKRGSVDEGKPLAAIP